MFIIELFHYKTHKLKDETNVFAIYTKFNIQHIHN